MRETGRLRTLNSAALSWLKVMETLEMIKGGLHSEIIHLLVDDCQLRQVHLEARTHTPFGDNELVSDM